VFAADLAVDDGCSTKANVQHSFKEYMDHKFWADKATCWPRKNKKYADNHGKLPL